MRISVVGAGYVGLVSSACFADRGLEVTCVDIDRTRVERIGRGEAPFYEPGLDAILSRNIGRRLDVTTDLTTAVLESELTFVAVGTPLGDRGIDLRFVRDASRQIGSALRNKPDYHVVVIRSTVVPGTTDTLVLRELERASGKRAGVDLGLGVNPEFLTEGEAVRDSTSPDRIVLGGIDTRTLDSEAEVYSSFPGIEVIRTNNKTAEMIKYASNALLATLISFSNELANLGAAIGDIDTVDVSRGLRSSRYLSTTLPDGERIVAPIESFLLAGCGFGGSCLPKDVASLVTHGREVGVDMDLLEAVLAVNDRQPGQIIRILEEHLLDLSGKRISLLGLAFRPDTSDMRASPAIRIVTELLDAGAKVRAFDPKAHDEARELFGTTVDLCEDLDDALRDSDAVVLVTRWPEFEDVPARLANVDPQPLFVDGRRMLDKSSIARYEGIGL